MNYKKIMIIFIVIIITIISNNEIYSKSVVMRSQEDYNFLIDKLRYIRTPIENFATVKQTKEYREIHSFFRNASEEHFARKFDSSHQKYFKVKKKLIQLMDEIAMEYINRTEEILDSITKQSFDIFIKYSSKSGFAKYFQRAFDPVKEIKTYNSEEYHFFYDLEKIQRFLNYGYKKLNLAKDFYNDPTIKLINNKKRSTSRNLNYIIKNYKGIISLCRISKGYGIEIYKIFKVNQIGDIIRKYQLTRPKIFPIFDDRIPDNYKVDANDNMNLIHSIEEERITKRKN